MEIFEIVCGGEEEIKMELQVVSFNLSNQLEEMGLPQNGIFAWYQYENQKPYVNLKNFRNYIVNENIIRDGDAVSSNMICDAPTVTELGEMLPDLIKGEYRLRTYKTERFWQIGFFDLDLNCKHDIFEIKEVDARARMWIYLKKEKIIK